MYRFRTSNVWLPSLSCLRPVRTCFTVTCPRLDENDGTPSWRVLELFGVWGDSVGPKDLKKCMKLNWNLGLGLIFKKKMPIGEVLLFQEQNNSVFEWKEMQCSVLIVIIKIVWLQPNELVETNSLKPVFFAVILLGMSQQYCLPLF